MTKTQSKKIAKLLQEIDIDISQEDIIDLESFDQLQDWLQDNDYFNVDIIYYSNAIEYLKENDTSLRESLSIASDYGYELENLSSEVLASILASQEIQEHFFDLHDNINEILED